MNIRITHDVDWPDARQAMRDGKQARRSLWITWVRQVGNALMFQLPHTWRGGRRYDPTDIDRAATDWQIIA